MKFFKEQTQGIPANFDSKEARMDSKSVLDPDSADSLILMKEVADLEKEELQLRGHLGIGEDGILPDSLKKDGAEYEEWKEIVEEYRRIRSELRDYRRKLKEFLKYEKGINN
jgi:hypothetical protein